jgi:hypothetical protein
MKQITIQFLDEQMVAAADAVADQRNYQATIDGKPNPESREDFAKKFMKKHITDTMAAIFAGWMTAKIRKESFDDAQTHFVVTVE